MVSFSKIFNLTSISMSAQRWEDLQVVRQILNFWKILVVKNAENLAFGRKLLLFPLQNSVSDVFSFTVPVLNWTFPNYRMILQMLVSLEIEKITCYFLSLAQLRRNFNFTQNSFVFSACIVIYGVSSFLLGPDSVYWTNSFVYSCMLDTLFEIRSKGNLVLLRIRPM